MSQVQGDWRIGSNLGTAYVHLRLQTLNCQDQKHVLRCPLSSPNSPELYHLKKDLPETRRCKPISGARRRWKFPINLHRFRPSRLIYPKHSDLRVTMNHKLVNLDSLPKIHYNNHYTLETQIPESFPCITSLACLPALRSQSLPLTSAFLSKLLLRVRLT